MSTRSSWIVSTLVAIVTIAVLLWVATYRFASPLVAPAPPTPDYALQAAIAIAGAVLVALAYVVTGVTAARSSAHRRRAFIIGSLSMIGVTLLASILAFTIPA